MNARFWHWTNDGWVKITLKPDQELTHSRGGRHEEGWQHRDTTFYYDGLVVERHEFSDGVDCDGRLSSESISTCRKWGLHALPCYIGSKAGVDRYSEDMLRPDWQHGKSSQRDYEAEKAGY